MENYPGVSEKHVRVNIVVIGAGGAGLSAAASAAEAGAGNLLVLESGNAVGGNSLFSKGLFASGTSLQKRLGFEVSKDAVFKRYMGYANWKSNARLVKKMIDKSSDTINWLESKGIKFDSLIPHCANPEFNTYHAVSGNDSAGSLIVKALSEQCRNSGVRIMTGTRAEKLFTDSDGRIAGVLANNADGEFIIHTRAVVLATGGMTGNAGLQKKYDPLYVENQVAHKGILHKGDGFMMALEIGAVTDGQITHEMSGPVFRDSICLTVAAMRPNTIWVNKHGERFTDESTASPMEAGNALYRQPGKIAYSIFNQDILQQIMNDELSPLERMRSGGISFKEKLIEDIDKFSKEGKIKVSDSWTEIAEWAGIPADVLEETIGEYNNSCDKGYDDLLGKGKNYLQTLKTPPYYAVPGKVSILVTHCGVKVNYRTEVLDKEDKVIPGFYAAGEDICGVVANTYNISLPGHSFGFAVNSGRIAGEEAAKFVAGKQIE